MTHLPGMPSLQKMTDKATQLGAILAAIGPAAIAVSGGVDSMTLAHLAHQVLGPAALMLHAVSPAVPAAASARVRAHGRAHGWQLQVIEADEFADEDYLKNPVNRCYFCKNNLYDRISQIAGERIILSGANLDDLGDYRPGLTAADEHQVRHPYIEAGISKAELRAIARALGLDDIAELPAQPCLASRVETGIAISSDDLNFIELVEGQLQALLGPVTLRCRITKSGVRVELAADARRVAAMAEVAALVDGLCRDAGRIFGGLHDYRRGSAFIQPPAGQV